MRILGIDPGLNTTGYGVVDVGDSQLTLVEAGIVTSKRTCAVDCADKFSDRINKSS